MGLKNLTIQGRLVRDPELRQTKTGTDVCSFTVAVDSNRPPKGDEKMPASFFRVTAFGKRGLVCEKYLAKGDECVVIGDIELDTYQSQEGKTHSNMQIIASDIHFGRKNKSESKPASESKDNQIQYESPVY